RRRGPAYSSENHDDLRYPVRAASNHVVAHASKWRRRDETDSCADDRRRDHFGHSGAVIIPGHLRPLAPAKLGERAAPDRAILILSVGIHGSVSLASCNPERFRGWRRGLGSGGPLNATSTISWFLVESSRRWPRTPIL